LLKSIVHPNLLHLVTKTGEEVGGGVGNLGQRSDQRVCIPHHCIVGRLPAIGFHGHNGLRWRRQPWTVGLMPQRGAMEHLR